MFPHIMMITMCVALKNLMKMVLAWEVLATAKALPVKLILQSFLMKMLSAKKVRNSKFKKMLRKRIIKNFGSEITKIYQSCDMGHVSRNINNLKSQKFSLESVFSVLMICLYNLAE